jgi:dihydrofolate reductase
MASVFAEQHEDLKRQATSRPAKNGFAHRSICDNGRNAVARVYVGQVSSARVVQYGASKTLVKIGVRNLSAQAPSARAGVVDPVARAPGLCAADFRTLTCRILVCLCEPAVTRVSRKIIVYIATSADGYIARLDGSVDWLDRPRIAGDYGMGGFYRSIDTILWGRKTYEVALGFQEQGIKGAEFDSKVTNYVFSHRPPRSNPPGLEFVREPLPIFAKRLRRMSGKNIWMMGGAGLIASFLDAGEIDEVIVHVVPVFIGEGIPLIAPRHRTVPLALRSCRRYSDGVVRLHYAVPRGGQQRKLAE